MEAVAAPMHDPSLRKVVATLEYAKRQLRKSGCDVAERLVADAIAKLLGSPVSALNWRKCSVNAQLEAQHALSVIEDRNFKTLDDAIGCTSCLSAEEVALLRKLNCKAGVAKQRQMRESVPSSSRVQHPKSSSVVTRCGKIAATAAFAASAALGATTAHSHCLAKAVEDAVLAADLDTRRAKDGQTAKHDIFLQASGHSTKASTSFSDTEHGHANAASTDTDGASTHVQSVMNVEAQTLDEGTPEVGCDLEYMYMLSFPLAALGPSLFPTT